MSLTVNFTDQSTPGPSGPITAWAWDFGDGATGATQNPSHTYAAYSSYGVTLTVTGTGVDGTANITRVIDVIDAAALAASFTDSVTGLGVTFTDTSTAGPSGPITGWAWDFGDGNTSTSQNPSHTYAASGSYVVTLTVTGTAPDGTSNISHGVSVTSGGAGPSGIPVPTSNLTGWTLHFTDDFTTACSLGDFPIYGVSNPSTPAAVAAKWTSYPDNYPVTRWKQDGAPGYYRTERTVSISGGLLKIDMHWDAGIGQYCCAAPIPRLFPAQTMKWRMASSLYGRYEVCLRQVASAGTYKIAWLLWPDIGGNSINGEIDCPEVNLNEAGNVHAFLHHAPSGSQSQTSVDMGVKLGPGWHTYAIEWTPASIKFLTDGVVKGQSTTNLPATSMYWVLQSELGLSGYTLSHADSVSLECDWVAFWTKT